METYKDAKAVKFSTVTEVLKKEGDLWEAVTTVTERVEMGDGSVLEEKVEASALEVTVRDAVRTTTESVLTFMIENVYKAGYDDLISYFAANRGKEKDGNKANSN